MRDYKKIRAWQLADSLVKKVYHVTRTFPKDEQFGLTSQLRRAAVSGATNIVEGSCRRTERDYLHFLWTSYASIAELGYLLTLSHDLEFLPDSAFEELLRNYRQTIATLKALINHIERAPEP